MKILRCICLFLAIQFSLNSYSQESAGIKFGHVSAEDFILKNKAVDTSYGAVIIADIGSSHFEGSNDGWFNLIYKHVCRIKIIDKKAFDLATVQIPLYQSTTSNDEEKLEALKASTYNLENGKVVETKMDKDNVFKDKLDKNHIVKKFTMPTVKEGSIIEYSYTIKSDFLFNLQPWAFQGSYPVLWSEYEVNVPAFFEYVTLSQGYLPFQSYNTSTKNSTYMLRVGQGEHGVTFTSNDIINLESIDKIVKWVVANAPALREEKFTSSINNHISKIEFQLSAYAFPNQPRKDILSSWYELSKDLLADKDFGADLYSTASWLEKDWLKTSTPTSNKLEEAVNIFHFVQKNIKDKGVRSIYLSQPLSTTYQNKNGFSSDINLLLTFLLNQKGFEVNPVILSTRSNGIAHTVYPLINQYNYVICKLVLDGKIYLLDAAGITNSFYKLPIYCYNGNGRNISNTSPTLEDLSPDNINESKMTNVFMMPDEKIGSNWNAQVQTYFGDFESSKLRGEIADKGKDVYTKKIQNSFPSDFTISDVTLPNIESNEKPLNVNYKINIDNNKSDIIYFSPMLKESITENYFKSQERLYPVEIPYKIDEFYQIRITIPEGYAVDELPKSERVNFNETEAYFQYTVKKTDEAIELQVVLKFAKATFMTEDYEILRSFFDYIVKKEAEQIVFKKKK